MHLAPPPPGEAKFAIIIPVFNTARYVGECLESVLSQTHKNFRAFLVDDGSTDSSGAILDTYASQDTRLTVVHKENGGVSSARNRALDLVEADGSFDYVLCLDSDDVLTPECLSTVSQYASCDRLLLFGVQTFDKHGPFRQESKIPHEPKYFSKEESFGFSLDGTCKAYSSSPAFSLSLGNVVLPTERIRGLRFDENLVQAEDQDFKMKVLDRCNGLLAISDLLLHYRLRKGSLSHNKTFRTDDLHVFLRKALEKGTSETIQKVIESKAAGYWWSTLKRSVYLGRLKEYWPESRATLQTMVENFRTGVLKSPRYRKRIRIFMLGQIAVWLYFSFQLATRPNSSANIDYFE